MSLLLRIGPKRETGETGEGRDARPLRIAMAVVATVVGASVMYFIDPQHGSRRRGAARARAQGLRHSPKPEEDAGGDQQLQPFTFGAQSGPSQEPAATGPQQEPAPSRVGADGDPNQTPHDGHRP
jgi:hypothetical protein